MKKLLAIILSWLTAFSNNVSYVEPPSTQGYQPGMYYKLETGELEPDYRTNQQISNQLDKRSVCYQNNYIATVLDYSAEYLRLDSSDGSDYAYWWQVNTTSIPCDLNSVDNSSNTVSIPANAIIVAPAGCRRITSADTVQPYPIGMTLEIQKGSELYIVSITGMYCWACDAFRDLPTVDNVPAIAHSYSDDGHNYSKGEVLGKADSGCVIEIWKKAGSRTVATNWAEFYGLSISGGTP